MNPRPKLGLRRARRHPLAAVARPAGPSDQPAAPAEAQGRPLEQAARTAGLLAVTSAVGWLLTSEPVSGPLAIPLTSLDELRRWLDDSTAAVLPAAILRLAALALCAYLALALSLTLAAQIVDRRTGGRAVRAVRRLLPATLRSLLTGGAQCSLVAASAFPLSALPATSPFGDPGPTATMAKLDPIETDSHLAEPVPTSTATMTRLPTPTVPQDAPTTAPTSLAPVPLPPRAPAPAITPDPDDGDDETWTVTPGDTFWSIAEEALTDRRGSVPPQHETVRYWRQLMATNQPRLAAPGNPDLLLPGQSLVLPPPN